LTRCGSAPSLCSRIQFISFPIMVRNSVLWFFIGAFCILGLWWRFSSFGNAGQEIGLRAGWRFESKEALEALSSMEQGSLAKAKLYLSLRGGAFFCEQLSPDNRLSCDEDCKETISATRSIADKVPELRDVIKDCEPRN
jgi:hypothetical protein